MLNRPAPHLVIDARPRGPKGPLAGELVLGRTVLVHQIDLALSLSDGSVVIHARPDEHPRLREMIGEGRQGRLEFAIGPPPEASAILRTDRLYHPAKLARALRRGRDPESAAVWRLDGPLGLAGADDELRRRLTYQPIGKHWALFPAQWLASSLRNTRVRPNALTVASAALMAGASALVAFAPRVSAVFLLTAAFLALALILDTADGRLARLQGTASEFGRWLDAYLDEWSDMTLHAAIAWSAYSVTGHVGWLLTGMLYGMGKYLFFAGLDQDRQTSPGPSEGPATTRSLRFTPHRPEESGLLSLDPLATQPVRVTRGDSANRTPNASPLARSIRLVGHADVRWHIWIALAVFGRLELALAAYAVYFPARSLAGASRRAMRHA